MRRPTRRSLAAGLAIALVASGCGSSSRPASQPSSAPTRPHVGFMVVAKSGVTQASDGAGGYGVVIANPTTRDALWVSLYIHLLDARSHVVGTRSRT